MTTSPVRLIAASLVALVLMACATTGEPDFQAGMESTSPVRSADINTRLGLGYLERGEYKIALERLQRAARDDPNHVPAQVGLALVYEQLREDAAADRHYRRAARLAPRDGATQNIYAVYLCRKGQLEEADRRFQTAMDDPLYDTPEVALANAGECAISNSQYEKAERYLRQALQIRPDFPAALFHMANMSYQQGNAMTARAFLQRFGAATAHDSESLKLGYRIEMALNNPSEARDYANRLEREFPESNEAQAVNRELPDD